MPTPVIIGLGGEIFSAVANGNVSGGALLQAGSYTSTVTAKTAAQYDYSKVLVSTGGSGLNCVGLALYDQASGTTNEVAVLRRGLIITNVDGDVLAGRQVEAAEAVAGEGALAPGANAGRRVGTALTEAASGGFCIALLNL